MNWGLVAVILFYWLCLDILFVLVWCLAHAVGRAEEMIYSRNEVVSGIQALEDWVNDEWTHK